MSELLERAILHRLTNLSPGLRLAFVIHESRVYYATDTPRQAEPSSPVLKLLQGIFELHRDLSFFILRKRIFLNYEPGPMDKGFMDLLAKRHSVLQDTQEDKTAEKFEYLALNASGESYLDLRDRSQNPSLSFRAIPDAETAHKALQELEEQVVRGEVLHDHRRPIAAILTDNNGHVLEWALHAGDINKSLHAEILLLQKLFISGKNKELPERLKLIVSLSPCRMCAGSWIECFGDRIEVLYKELDPGRMAQNTELIRRHQQRPL